jgi:hypothetical protein
LRFLRRFEHWSRTERYPERAPRRWPVAPAQWEYSQWQVRRDWSARRVQEQLAPASRHQRVNLNRVRDYFEPEPVAWR